MHKKIQWNILTVVKDFNHSNQAAMARSPCDLRLLLLAAAVAFIYIQVREHTCPLFVSMSAVQSWSRLFGLSILITLFSPMNSFNLHHYEWAILMQSLHSGAPLRNTIPLCWPSCRSSMYYCLSVFCFYPFFIYAFPLEVFICGLTAGLETKALSKSKLFTPVICPIQEKSENQCTSQLKSLIDQVSMQQEKIVALEGTNTSNLHPHMIFFGR